MSGGRKISDHKFWAGGPSKEHVLPVGGAKVKHLSSAEGAGAEMDYEDTTEKIHAQQEIAKKKVHAHPHKVGYRN